MAGHLGNGETSRTEPSPVEVEGLFDAVELGSGTGYTCARRRSGQVVCWGANRDGMLGDGTAIARSTPVSVLAP